jgi:hypothetical protein
VSTDVLVRPAPAPATPPKRKKKRRRRRFSLNGLAIQLAAFALSFTLVALLVVSGSQQAFVEESEAIQNYVPIGTTAPPPGEDFPRPGGVLPHPPTPTSPTPTTPLPPEEAPLPEPDPVPEPEVPDTVVRLADTDAGTAMFGSETTLAPGVTDDRCIQVSYDGDLDPLPVMLYAAVASGDLAPYLDLSIEIGDAASGAFGDCSTFVPAAELYRGTLAEFATAFSSYFSGLPTWDPAEVAEVRTFRFTVEVQDNPAAEGKSVAFGFSWETRDAA